MPGGPWVRDRPRRKRATARLDTGINEHTAGEVLALRESAASDAGLAGMRECEQRRRISIEQGARWWQVVPSQPRRPAGCGRCSPSRPACRSPGRSWIPQQYEAWLASTIDRLLPGPDLHNWFPGGMRKGAGMNMAERRAARTCRVEVIADAPA